MKIEFQEFQGRRQKLAASMSPNTVALILSAEIQYRNHDTEHKFRQASSFWYLTGFAEPNAALLLKKSASGELQTNIFVQRKDPAQEVWTGIRTGAEKAKLSLGVDRAFCWDELLDELPAQLHGVDQVYFDFGTIPHALLGRKVLEQITKQRITKLTSSQNLIGELRLFKSASEIALMRQSAEINVAAHKEAIAKLKANEYEYQTEARLEAYFREHGATWAYPSIVAGGRNATILHYSTNHEELREGDLVLIDAGCEYENYASDITRTFPIGKTFSEPQREIYTIVLNAQKAALECLRKSSTHSIRFDDFHQETLKVLTQGLIELGIINGASLSEALERKLYHKYYMHRTGHWLGLDVHDLGSCQDDQGRSRLLESGMVLTVEPGLYFSPDDETVPSRYRGIGIRIEDDVLITKEGVEVLTAALPKEICELEDLRDL
ncbi:MAG: aminopeptidase P N-terminal domain-containing protein [Candidatus Caenarcaniphilales bacterium]|nr:aminopeptidase P N-terminal domain-containing protein [Candidatus Caenarcaniphilales bacterium]